MKPFLQDVRCPVLSANLIPDETLSATFGKSFLPYKIFTVDGQQVAVVGYTTKETPFLSMAGR